MTKKALVINGGGSKGAFAVGVLKQLFHSHPELQFDIFCGTSSGALIASLAALGEIDLLEKMFTGNKTQDIIATGNILERFVNNNSLYNATPLQLKIGSILTDSRFSKLISSGKSLFIGCNNLQTARITYFTNSKQSSGKEYDLYHIGNPQIFRAAAMAAYCLPIFMPPIQIGNCQYADVRILNHTPLQLTIDHGATDIYVISHLPNEITTSDIEYRNVLDILEQTADWLSIDTMQAHLPIFHNQALEYLHNVKSNMIKAGLTTADIDAFFDTPHNPFTNIQQVNIHLIKPDQMLDGGPGGLDYVPDDMRRMIAAGIKKAAEMFP
ncbi:patatin-like phospholipase family protein [Chitinophaga sp. Hz27]|uniref:patatin-like phospholipase family protein n=1 Tax=Chitinophaga sp. Hz27 TaxID=3347169 RepID=UPI0035E0CED7